MFDTVIRNATLYDGSGGSPFGADVALEGDRIAVVGTVRGEARREITATGLALAPGFIDVHSHDDFAALIHRDMAFKALGGVTTCIVGNCGFGAAPRAEAATFARAFHPDDELPSYDGYGGYLAHLESGVLGLSTGLIYEPGCHAGTGELIELASELHGTRGLYATHMRDEAARLVESVDEAIRIGEAAGVPVQISHHKAFGRPNWGLVSESLRRIERARAAGTRVHADQYPYTAGSTVLAAVVQTRMVSDRDEADVSPGDVVVASSQPHPEWEGRSLEELAGRFGCSAMEAADRVLGQAPGTTVVLHGLCEDDVQTVLRHPSTMIGSDGIPTLGGKPHPRLYNSFARVLGHYAREVGILSLPEAVRRMTGLAADTFGLDDRGYLREGSCADLVLFDADAIIDRGTFAEPNQYPDGIHQVFVNGVEVARGKRHSGALPGRALRRRD
jgi:N-acyl-D-amino-acid deacylase